MSKQELMEEVVSEIRICRRCQLWRTAKNPVPGEGSLDTSLMFIGEAPGYWEDSVGRPFMGAAGQLLDKLLASIGLKRDEVYIGNMVKPRPPDNRDPRRDEVEACTPYLDRQIMILKPSLILTMGRHSTSSIFSKVNVKV
jgi:DNA polymerase